ncbi:type IV pilus biogenesis protein PilM [Fredinandcohnia humi]
MSLSFFSKSNKIVNLIIKDHVIRFIELKQVSPLQITNSGEYYIPEGIIHDGRILDHDTLATILEQCIDEWGIRKRSVRFIVPDSFITIRTIKVPAELKDDEIKGYLYLELGETIHLPFEDPVFDIKVIRTDRDKKDVLVFAGPEEIVTEYSTLLSELTLKPIAADVSPLCLYRLLHYLDLTKPKQHTMILQYDVTKVNISIFHNHLPIFMRHITLITNDEDWQITPSYVDSKPMEEEFLQAQYNDLIKEITHVMDFYRYSLHQDQVDRILLTGDNPSLQHFYNQLENSFNQSIEIVKSIPTNDDQQVNRYFHLALGLALKGVQ